MGSRYISSSYQLDLATNRFLDDFPVHCHFRDGLIGQRQMHAHRGYEFYFCLDGQGKLLLDDHMVSLVPGTIAIIKPHELHLPSVIGTKPLHRVVLSVDEHYVQTSFNTSPGISHCVHTLFTESKPYWLVAAARMDMIRNLLLRLTRELAEQRDYYQAAMHHLLAELFVILTREQCCPPDPDHAENASFHLAERILRYLTTHYAESIEVSRLHERFNVSRSHMYDHFKQATGHSLNRYLTLYRIHQAKRLLLDTQLSVTEIASAVGYGDLSHFFHTFKSETGLTPNTFRKQTGQ
jgi:AraC-like DNA-binding protein